MPQLTLKFTAQQRNLRLIVLLTWMALGGLLGYLVYNERELILDREGDSLLHQARLVDANLAQQLLGMNAALISVRQEVLLHATPEQFKSDVSVRLHTLTDAMPGVRTMLIADTQGQVLASSRADALGLNVSQRAYFKSAQVGADPDAVLVSEPFKTTFNVYSLNLVRSLRDMQQRFAGIATATLDPEYFQVLLGSVLYASDMRATLIHGSGKIVMTLPVDPRLEGVDLARPGSLFSEHMASGKVESIFNRLVPLTGDVRLVAYRSIQPIALHMDTPLVLAVSREMDAVLAPWRQLVRVYGLSYLLVSVLLFVSVGVWQHQQRAVMALTRLREQESREQAQRLDLALGGADLGLWDLDLTTGTRLVNARAQAMLGYGPDDPVDTLSAWEARIHPEDRAQVRASRMAHQQGDAGAMNTDYRVQHKDGHWIWIHSRGKVTHQTPDGQPLRIMGTYLDITERKEAEARIAEFAFMDALTQLPNRRLLMDRLAQAQAVSGRSGQTAALMFLDLDRFKWVNDTLGHESGDLLLQTVAQRLRSCVRHSDTVARLGGDEFVVVLPEMGNSQGEAATMARALADKVLATLREPVMLGTHSHEITSSIGITLFVGAETNAAQLLKQADQALYVVKERGRNGACIYGIDLPAGEGR